ncbi:hypothetical protein Acsp03_51350 [Actinomadura sp. NBRC 104412]|uniref:PP2C family protein-serine/threonine phosphatase n=1 Tax=Actinomadura sp. NBRC 104412 TaxID=3032203 RepID=UPI0024A1F322|nr:GAF domain-containing SpoIIE family protein phosphatase [Actinomadura sp. NBRC 104412]GLZ07669.1 hypothetical protein Acsp03_51350 [Actinomadura sp. NBRC 104412]
MAEPRGGERDQIQAKLQRLATERGEARALLDAVVEISRHLELEEVLEAVARAAQEVVNARIASVGVPDEEGRFGKLISSGSGAGSFAEQVGDLPTPGNARQDPLRLRLDQLTEAQQPTIASLLTVPIPIRGAVYGHLYLIDKAGGRFTDRDQQVATALAGAAGVSIENARLYARLRAATEDFQRRLLPSMPQLSEWTLEARYEPSGQAPNIGGDWYDLIHLPEKVPCLMVGDVMGHDVRAATVMSQISNMLRVIAFDQREPPSRILQRLDEVLHALHGGPMATVIVARLEGTGPSRRIWWSSAGHLPPLLAVPGEPARYLDTEAGPPLGVAPELDRPDNEHFMPAGATVILHTDGLVEDRAHTLQQGMDRAVSIAATHADCPLPQLCDTLLAGSRHPLEDDVALLAARLAV